MHGVLTTVETEIKYAGYIAQQERQIERLKEAEGRRHSRPISIPGFPGLSREVRTEAERVSSRRPWDRRRRIPGVTPAAIAVLDVYLSTERAIA